MYVHRAACALSAHVFAMVRITLWHLRKWFGDNFSLKVLVMAYISVVFPIRQNLLGIIYFWLLKTSYHLQFPKFLNLRRSCNLVKMIPGKMGQDEFTRVQSRGMYHQEPASQLITLKSQIFPIKSQFKSSIIRLSWLSRQIFNLQNYANFKSSTFTFKVFNVFQSFFFTSANLPTSQKPGYTPTAEMREEVIYW